MNDLNADKLAIRALVENWVLYRDAGDWERFATVWHPDGWMTATWFQGPAAKFNMDPVDPDAVLYLDPDLLSRFPEGYRHLAYLQSKNGMAAKPELPGLRGTAKE